MTAIRRAFVSTVPFSAYDARPLAALAAAGIEAVINPLGRRLSAAELAGLIGDADVLIAGTEPITADVLAAAPRLRLIARVGIGLDNVDLVAARRAGIAVSYTPDAPSPAVAELAVGLMLDLLRHITPADRSLRGGDWRRFTGRRLADCTVGVVGVGRIGGRVLRHLAGGFPGVRLLAHDIAPRPDAAPDGVVWTDFATLCGQSDIVSLHVPLTPATRPLLDAAGLAGLRPDALLVNTARGGVVDEAALADALTAGRLGGAAVDTFAHEPYDGPLARLENCLVTCHMGSMTRDCRARMEIEAVAEAVRFAAGAPLQSPVPEIEYDLAAAG